MREANKEREKHWDVVENTADCSFVLFAVMRWQIYMCFDRESVCTCCVMVKHTGVSSVWAWRNLQIWHPGQNADCFLLNKIQGRHETQVNISPAWDCYLVSYRALLVSMVLRRPCVCWDWVSEGESEIEGCQAESCRTAVSMQQWEWMTRLFQCTLD